MDIHSCAYEEAARDDPILQPKVIVLTALQTIANAVECSIWESFVFPSQMQSLLCEYSIYSPKLTGSCVESTELSELCVSV